MPRTVAGARSDAIGRSTRARRAEFRAARAHVAHRVRSTSIHPARRVRTVPRCRRVARQLADSHAPIESVSTSVTVRRRTRAAHRRTHAPGHAPAPDRRRDAGQRQRRRIDRHSVPGSASRRRTRAGAAEIERTGSQAAELDQVHHQRIGLHDTYPVNRVISIRTRAGRCIERRRVAHLRRTATMR